MSRVHHSWAMMSVLVAMAFCVATPAIAIDMYWTGEGDNDNWYSRHFTGQYDSESRPIYVNNWGQMGIDPPTPGTSDHAIVGGDYTAEVNYQNAPSIWELSVGAPATLWIGNAGSLTVNGPSILNQGLIQIAYVGYAGGGTLSVTNGTVTGGGAIEFTGAGTLSGALTLESGNLIHGSGGHLTAWLVNGGTVNADVNNSWLSLETGAKTNEGVFSASGGGRLEVRTSINQTDLGRIVAGDSSTVQYYNGSSVSGGTTESSGTGKHFITGQNVTTTLTDITNTGHWLAQDGSIVNLTGSTFTNNGTFEIGGYTGGSGWGTMRLDSNVMLAGSGDLLLDPGIVDSPSGFTLTNSATHTIHGHGKLQAAIDNRGQVIADRSGLTLSLENAPKSNQATMKATGGATLAVKTAITQSASGQIAVEDNSRAQYFNGAGVSGGTSTSSGSGLHLVNGGGVSITLNDVTNTGNWLAENGSIVNLAGSTFTNDGTFEIGGYTGGSGWATLMPADGMALQGSGTLLLTPGYVNTPTPVTMTNAAGHTISGSGGRIYSNVTVNNLGTIEANGGTVELQTAPTQFSGATLTGGTWKAINGSLTVGGSPAVTTNQATVALSGSSSAFAPINSLADNQGSFSILGGRTFNTAGALTNSGTIEIDVSSKLAVNGGYTQTAGMTSVDGTLSTTTGMVLSGGELAGTGTINGATTVEAGATLSPGHSAGVLTFQRLALNSGAIYNFEIDGPNADRIDIIGSGDVFTLASGGVFTINLDVLNSTGAISEYTLFHWVGSTAIPTDTTWLVTGAPGVSGVVEIRPDLNSIMLTNVIVPEPLSISLFVVAAMGLLARRRSR